MELIKYLNDNYYTKSELLHLAKVSEPDFIAFQEKEIMPLCSYRLNLDVDCYSFFGRYQEKSEIEYYPKGYSSWLGIILVLKTFEQVYSVFSQRYISALESLKGQGYVLNIALTKSNLECQIKKEWKSFLDGIYGLCTKSGLPEDIVAKELAVLEINEICQSNTLSKNQIEKLIKHINLLDLASSMFAPHERFTSSRQRLITEICRKYKLKS